MRNFLKIASGLDPWPLLHALRTQPELWNQFGVRKSHQQSVNRDVDDVLLRYPKFNSGDDFIEKVYAEIEAVDYPAWWKLPQAHQFVYGTMQKTLGVHLGRVIISRLASGGEIPVHSDRLASVESAFSDRVPPGVYYDRYLVALQSEPRVKFTCGGEQVEMAPGEIWWFDHQQEHSVLNGSPADRISMIIDIRTRHDNYIPS